MCQRAQRLLTPFLLAIILALAALHFVRLSADFPAQSWWDIALFTDEGWYSIAAVNSVNTGHWAVPGDLNPGIATPVFPALVLLGFKLTGSNLVTARIVESIFFLLILLFTYLLASRLSGRRLAILAAAMCSASYFCFSFSRVAFLEYPMLLFVLVVLYLASCWRERPVLRGIAVALAVVLAFLTKMACVFAIVPLIYLLYQRSRTRSRFVLSLISFVITDAILIGSYTALALSRYSLDLLTFFQVQPPMAPGLLHVRMMAKIAMVCFKQGFSMGPVIYLLALLGASIYLFSWKNALRRPLFVVSFLWTVSYFGYLTERAYAPIRYYVVLYPALIFLLLESIRALSRVNRRIAIGVAAILCMCAIVDIFRIVDYVSHPQYSFIKMAEDVRARVIHGRQGAPVLLGNFSDSVSLVNYLPAINDKLGSKPLEWRLDNYRPGYYLVSADGLQPSADDVDWRKKTAHRIVESRFKLELVSQYSVFGTGRPQNNVYLFKLLPK
jgi:4-amino-4-deoxy-L-arabinose transferase-like glycosyltransferase